jgi:hypothetical protein
VQFHELDRRSPYRLLFVLLGFACAATIVAAVASNGSVVAAIAPTISLALVGAIWIAPLRVTLLLLIFLGLALDTPGDASGQWQSPLAPLGRLLTENLNRTIPVQALRVSALTLLIGYLLLIHVHRRLSAFPIEDADCAQSAPPMLRALAFSLLTLIGLCAYGISQGGDVQLCNLQVQNFVLLLLVAYLLAVSLRGVRDYRTLGGVILAAACTKAVMAVWVRLTVVTPTPDLLATATTHGDSMLFVCAAAMLLGLFFEQPVRRHARLCLAILPLLLAGMIANNRRLAWVEAASVILTLYVISPRTSLKRMVARTVLLVLPLVLVYGAAGWSSNSPFFAPVQLLRSMDPQRDRSTLDRDVENFNLVYSLDRHPVLGTGFGHPYTEVVKLDEMPTFKEYRFLPHNSILGLWSFGGILGFTGLWAAPVIGVLLAARSYLRGRSAEDRTVAFTVIASMLIYTIQCWGDMGFGDIRSVFLVSSAMAVAGQLAMLTGAWGTRPARKLRV